MKLYTIKNDYFTLTASSYGAELQSLLSADGIEVVFQGDNKWSGKSPNIFPLIGVFDDGCYTFEGKTYDYTCHGVAPCSEYKVSLHTENELEFCLESNEETKKMYPFEFKFFVNYKLDCDRLIYTVRAENTDSRPIYCEMGTHTGFCANRNFEGSRVIFDSPEENYTVKHNDPQKCGARLINENRELPLSNWLFDIGAVTFGSLNSKSVTLKNEGSDYSVTVGLGNYGTLSLWSAPGSSYVCIEPWSCESTHYAGKNIELIKQVDIDVILPGESKSYYNTVSISRN